MKKRVLSLFLAITLCLTLTPTGALATDVQPPEPPVSVTQNAETPTPAPQKEEPLPEQTVTATQETETPTHAPQKEESTAPAENGADENASPASPDEKPTENTPAAAEKNPADEEPGKEPAAATGKDEPKADGSPSDDDAAKVQNRLVMAAAAEPGEPTMMGQNNLLALADEGQTPANAQNGEGGGIYVAPGSPTEGGGGTYISGEDTRTEIWCTMKPSSIQRGYDGTTDGSKIPINLTFTDGTKTFELEERTGFTATKTFDSADAGSRTVTVEIELIGEAAAKYKLKAGQEKFEIGGYIDKAYPDLTVTLSKTTCTVGEKLLPLLSVSGVQENAAVTYYYTPINSGYLEFEGSEAVPAIDENTAISSFDEEGNNTYYVYAKTAETKNYKEERSATVALTVTEPAAASVTTSGGVTNNYTSLDDALDAMKDDDTVTLLSDAEITRWHSLSKAFTLELNGKTATTQSKEAELYLHARVIVQDSSTEKTGGMAGAALLNVQDGGDLIIQSGTFNGRITINDGKLTIEGGTFNQEVGLPRGDSDSVFFSGGTFAKIWYPNSSGSFLDLLADGYAFFYTKDSNLVNAAEISETFLYNVQVQQHTHSFTDGACACGYTCPHTSVDASGTCAGCHKQFAASVTVSDAVTYYDTFSNALVYATQNDGCTLKLLTDVTGMAVMINNPFIFDLNGHNVDQGLSTNAKATIKDSGTTKGRIGKVTVSNEKVTDLTLGDLLEEGYAFQYENGSWANDSHLQTSAGLSVTVRKAPIQSVAVYAKDKNHKEVSTIAYGTTGEVTLVSSCRMGETSGADLSYLWYKLEGLAATAPLEGATGANYTLPDNLAAGTHTYLLICTSGGYSKSAEITITVTPISLEDAEVTVQSPTYNGKLQEPKVTVKLGDKTLSRDNDYTMEVTKQTDAGSYKLTIKGGGNYTGTIEKDWKIEPLPISLVSVSSISKTYDGSADVTLTADKLTFFSKTARRQDITLPDTALSFSNAQFTKQQADGSYLPSPEVGSGKALSFTMTLTSNNYVFEGKSEGTTEVSDVFTTDDVSRFTITKAAAPTNIQSGTLNIINGTQQTYIYDFSKLLPELSDGEYGTVSYGNQAAISVVPQRGYYYDPTIVEFKNGKLILAQFYAKDGTMIGQIGTVNVTVTTTNYEDFQLTLVLNAINKPTPDDKITASDITYGQALSASTITGTMKDPTTGKEITGTFTWTDGTVKPNAGSHNAEWIFTPDESYGGKYTTYTDTATVKVNPKAVTVSGITAKDKVYDGNTDAVLDYSKVTLNGVLENDTLTVTVTGTFESANAGKQKVKISGFKLGGNSVANYVLAESGNQTETTATITVREATVTPDNKAKVYEEKDPDLTYAVRGVLDGETLKGITLTRAEGENAGEYAITATADADANPNYDVTFAKGKFTINPKSIDGATVKLGKGLTANGAEQTQTVEKVLLDGKELPADSYTVAGNTATAPGSHTLTITAKGNYTGTVKQTYVIAPAKAEDAPGEEIVIDSGKVKVVVKSEGAVPPATLLTDKAELLAMLVDSGDITADELAQIADGASVDIALTVKEANVLDEVKTAMAQAAKGYTIGQYLDISLFKYMTVNGKQQDGVALRTTKNALTISVVVPDALINTNSAVNRTYCIVRRHDGAITVLDAAFDAASKTLTFKTDRFSDYAIAYKDTAVPSSGSNPSSNNSSNDSDTKKNDVAAPTPAPTPASTSKPSTITAMPQTGDTSNPMLYVVLLVASLLGLAVVFVCKKRNDK